MNTMIYQILEEIIWALNDLANLVLSAYDYEQ